MVKRVTIPGIWFPYWYIATALRRIWGWSPIRKAVKDQDVVCAMCLIPIVNRAERHVDHIVPIGVIPRSFDGWDQYLRRMFCERAGLQVLCRRCHVIKTKADAIRAKNDRV